MNPRLIQGGVFKDERGELKYNNDFDASEIKRMYIIENSSIDLKRGWKAHKIEQRWFISLIGSFVIKIVAVEDFKKPQKKKQFYEFVLESKEMNVLHCPAGHATLIQALEPKSKILALGDFLLGETQDEYRFPLDYFMNISEI